MLVDPDAQVIRQLEFPRRGRLGHAQVGVRRSLTTNQALSEMIGMQCLLLSVRADVFRVERSVAFAMILASSSSGSSWRN